MCSMRCEFRCNMYRRCRDDRRNWRTIWEWFSGSWKDEVSHITAIKHFILMCLSVNGPWMMEGIRNGSEGGAVHSLLTKLCEDLVRHGTLFHLKGCLGFFLLLNVMNPLIRCGWISNLGLVQGLMMCGRWRSMSSGVEAEWFWNEVSHGMMNQNGGCG